MPKKRVVLAVHGGAGIILRSELEPELEEQYRSALKDALRVGYAILTKSKEELDNDANAQSKVAAGSGAKYGRLPLVQRRERFSLCSRREDKNGCIDNDMLI